VTDIGEGKMEIAIRGEGELIVRFIDNTGQTLMQERLTVSGSSKTQALRVIELSLRTAVGDAAVAPVLVGQSNPAQRVRFDNETPARFTRRRCKEIGCPARVAAEAARGVAPPPVPGDRPSLSSNEPALARLINLVSR
jgi:hypothetical protein